MINIRTATQGDADTIWSILQPVFRAGETYCVPRDIAREGALAYWLGDGHEVFVAEDVGTILGTYFICTNQPGGGSHVCNCGYVTAPAAQCKGVARTMLEHSLDHAKASGYRAMQYNFVVSSNQRAVKTWQSYGFEIAGRLPGAFDHPVHGFVDALVMYRQL